MKKHAKVLGLRAEPSAVHWAVVSGITSAPVLEAADTIPGPVNMSEAEVLAEYRGRLRTIVDMYKPEAVVIRLAESLGKTKKTPDRERSRIEGVLMETGHSKGLPVAAGPLKTISAQLGSASAKKYIETDDLRGLDWSEYTKNLREAILIGVAFLKD